LGVRVEAPADGPGNRSNLGDLIGDDQSFAVHANARYRTRELSRNSVQSKFTNGKLPFSFVGLKNRNLLPMGAFEVWNNGF
jgi:hypothetical protein